MGGGRGGGLDGEGGGNHVQFPCYIRRLYGKNIDMCLVSSV